MAPVRSDSSISPSVVDPLVVALCAIDAFLVAASLIFTVFLCCGGGDEADEGGGTAKGGKKAAMKKKGGKKAVGGEEAEELESGATSPGGKVKTSVDGKTSPAATSKSEKAPTEAVTETNAATTTKSGRRAPDRTLASATAGPGGGAGPSVTAAKTMVPTMATSGRTRAPSALDATGLKSRTQAPFVATQVAPRSLVSKTMGKASAIPGDYITLTEPKGDYISLKSATKALPTVATERKTIADTTANTSRK